MRILDEQWASKSNTDRCNTFNMHMYIRFLLTDNLGLTIRKEMD